MKSRIYTCLLLITVVFAMNASADEPLYRPFVLASAGEGTLAASTNTTVSALEAAGYQVAGQYSPLKGTNIIVVTSDALKEIASKSNRGGYAAGQRVSVTEADGKIEVSFINPLYIQYAYRLGADMQPVYDSLTAALGMVKTCGAGNKKMTAKKLSKYNYMMGMQHFDNPYYLASFGSHAEAVSAVETGLAKADNTLLQVYRIDIPGTEQTVFGVGVRSTNEENKALDETYQMSIVDFEGCKKHAYYPYEVLVTGTSVESLHMRFRMAVHFPDLSMMGSHGFTKLMPALGDTKDAFEEMVGKE
jgi:hypothetical protein